MPQQQMKKSTLLVWLAALGCLLLVGVLSTFVASSGTEKPDAGPQTATPLPQQPERVDVDRLTLRGATITIDVTTADELFAVFTKADEVGEPHVHADPLLPGSLDVVHTYRVDGKEYTFWLDRKTADGPYLVSLMKVR